MLVQLLLLVFCQTTLAGRVGKPFYDTNDYEAMGRHFEEYLVKHDKNYDAIEKALRFVNFIENVVKINKLNELYDTMFDINHLTDLSEAELSNLRGLRRSTGFSNYDGDCKVLKDPTTKDAPAAFDWRDHGAVSPVKDQRTCGSCWAFSTTAMMESRYLQQGKNLTLSEQQLVDCDKNSSGCDGGLMSLAATYLINNGGQEAEDDYPYVSQTGYKCHFDASKIAVPVHNCTDYQLSSEDALKELLYKEGPLAIGVGAFLWGSYKRGIFKACDDTNIDHGVLLVGYGSENGEDFWIIKNSWSTKFGEDGFIRILRGVNCCAIGGIGVDSGYPAITSATIG